ncbi:MAG TPA: FHA domain-containing protein [Archangium sp.]|nr:FHA domain-containing protein [Archangium sp.]
MQANSVHASTSRTMGILEQTESKRRFSLGSRCLLGRHPACDIRQEDARISGEHASLHWKGEGWELRDLGSKNGTFLEGRKLGSGERVPMTARQTLVLGPGGARFQLVDANPPAARARRVTRQEVREASGSLLLLPDDEVPLASLFLDVSGRWVLESGDVHRHVADQERLRLGEEDWVLELPTATPETLEGGQPTLDGIHLKIGVSRDEEHVVVTVVHDHQHKVLSPRAYHYLLATLARVRLKDHGTSEAEQGWVDREELCRMLATDSNKLNVDIHRVRKQLSALGIQDAAGVVERRPGSGHVRLGIRSVEVFAL